MATHPPAPTPEHRLNSKTDHRESWPIWYTIFAGGPLIAVGVALSGWPLIYVAITATLIVVLWILQLCGEAYAKPRLVNVPVQGSLWTALWVVIIGVIAWLIGKVTHVIFVDFIVGLTEAAGILIPIIAFIAALMAAMGLLLSVSYNTRRATVVCLIAFGIVVMFMTQQGLSATETPFEQLKQTCEQQASDFPEECG